MTKLSDDQIARWLKRNDESRVAIPAESPDGTSFADAESMLPAAARCDIAIDGFDAIESQVSTVTEVEVPSLTLTVSIDPNAMDPLSARVIPLAIVVIEFRCMDESTSAWSRKNGATPTDWKTERMIEGSWSLPRTSGEWQEQTRQSQRVGSTPLDPGRRGVGWSNRSRTVGVEREDTAARVA